MTNKIFKKLLMLISFLVLHLSVFLQYPFNEVQAAGSIIITGPNQVYPNQTLDITVFVTRDQAYNAVDISINVDAFSIQSVSLIGGWTPIAGPTTSGNTISFSGAILGQQLNGQKEVLSIRLTSPNSLQNITITGNGSVSGEGFGTGSDNISGSKTINVAPTPTPSPTPSPTPTPTPRPRQNTPTPTPNPQNLLPSITSITSISHPEPNKWYNSKNVTVTWTANNNANGFNYEFSKNPTANLPNEVKTTSTTVSSELSEGENYFHVKARNNNGWGQVSSFKINIDTSPPEDFDITINQINNSEYQISFNTTDSLSGINRYEVYIDNVLLSNNVSPITVQTSFSEVKVIAFDNAGNPKATVKKLSSTQTPTPTSINNDRSDNNTNNTTNNTAANSKNAQENQNNSEQIGLIASLILNIALLIYSIVISYLYFFKKNSSDTQTPSKQEEKSISSGKNDEITNESSDPVFTYDPSPLINRKPKKEN